MNFTNGPLLFQYLIISMKMIYYTLIISLISFGFIFNYAIYVLHKLQQYFYLFSVSKQNFAFKFNYIYYTYKYFLKLLQFNQDDLCIYIHFQLFMNFLYFQIIMVFYLVLPHLDQKTFLIISLLNFYKFILINQFNFLLKKIFLFVFKSRFLLILYFLYYL